MDSNDLIEYARRASQLGTCRTRLEHIRRQSECLASQARQSKSKLKAAMLVPASIHPAQASVIRDNSILEKSYRTTYLSLNMLSKHLTELCVVATTMAHRVHALGLQPHATFRGLKTITPRLCSALGELDEATALAEAQLLDLKHLVDHASCGVDQLVVGAGVIRHRAIRSGILNASRFFNACRGQASR
jgi:hypothetical protein